MTKRTFVFISDRHQQPSSSSLSSSSPSSSSLHYLPAERIAKKSSWRHPRRPDRSGTPAWSHGKSAGSLSARTWWWPREWRAPPACVGRQGLRRPRSSLKRPRVLQVLLLQVRKPFTPKTAPRLRDAPSRALPLVKARREKAPFGTKGFSNPPVARDERGRFHLFLLFYLREKDTGRVFSYFFSFFQENHRDPRNLWKKGGSTLGDLHSAQTCRRREVVRGERQQGWRKIVEVIRIIRGRSFLFIFFF